MKKLCIHCKHFKERVSLHGAPVDPVFGFCFRRTSPIDGRRLERSVRDERLHTDGDRCGPSGQYFEPKE